MSQDFHNPDETTYDLISRLRKEARDSHSQPGKSGYTPHSSQRKGAQRHVRPGIGGSSRNSHRAPHVNFNPRFKKFKWPNQIFGLKLSTVLMGVSTLFALGILAVGLTILFANRTAGSPADGTVQASIYDVGSGDYGDATEAEEYDEYTGYPHEYYYEDDTDSEADFEVYGYTSPEEDNEEATAEGNPFTLLDATRVIETRLEILLYQLEITVTPQEWDVLLTAFAAGAYYAYRDADLHSEDWRILIADYAELAFLESEWVTQLAPPPEEAMEYEEDYEEETETEATLDEAPPIQPTPLPTPAPTNPSAPPIQAEAPPAYEDPQGQIVFINLTKILSGQRIDIVVPFVYNQRLIDLFVREFHLRLAVDNPSVFPYDEHTMIDLANNIARFYITHGADYAEYRLRNSITALERAEIAQQ